MLVLVKVLTCLLCTQTVAANEPAQIESELRRAKNEYAYGNYDKAAEQLRALVYPMRLYNDEQVIETRKYLALSYHRLKQPELAKLEFKKLLYLSPDYQLDPYTVPPAIIELLEAVRLQMKPELEAIRQRQSDEQQINDSKQIRLITLEKTMIEHSDFATLLPFGVGQFQNGDYGWGAFFASTELFFIAVNITAHLWAKSYGPTFSSRTIQRRVQALTIAQYGAVALFGFTWSLGVMQARVNFQPLTLGSSIVHEEGKPKIPSGGSLHFNLNF
ncbi:MAG: hypothetical protein JW841_03130 [Deltaproteobacteria bacterium]|nr:hypothetical protein [Deltaproteobacteria bacterium]